MGNARTKTFSQLAKLSQKVKTVAVIEESFRTFPRARRRTRGILAPFA
jgi:hypothetical protein